jgi:hypothetical protein
VATHQLLERRVFTAGGEAFEESGVVLVGQGPAFRDAP